MSDAPQQWQPAPTNLTLARNEVHIWRVALALPSAIVAQLHATLAPDEQARAERFHFPQHQSHFTIARACLRDILGRYTGTSPVALCFAYTTYGKPFLQNNPAELDLRFNLSHAHELALIAVTRAHEIGVDIEQIRQNLDWEALMPTVFSTTEVRAIQELPVELRRQAFFTCWTRKEAYIKAIGEGLSHPLAEFDVSVHPHEPARLLGSRADPQAAQRWSLVALNLDAGYVGAVATAASASAMHCWQWTPPTPSR